MMIILLLFVKWTEKTELIVKSSMATTGLIWNGLPVAVSLQFISFLSLQGKSPLLLFFFLSLLLLFLGAQGSLPTVSCQDKEHPGSDD